MLRFLILSSVALAMVGCNRSPFPVAAVRGSVTIDGQPMTQGKVMLAPVARNGLNSGRPAFGHIQPDGSFTLSTYGDEDGAVVGDHWVSVVNGDPATGDPATKESNRSTGVQTNKWNFKQIKFPRQTVSVVAGQENQIDISLTSQDIAKYGRRAKADD